MTKEQRKAKIDHFLKTIDFKGGCPFCDEKVIQENYHVEDFEGKLKHWYLVHNLVPYSQDGKTAEKHYTLILKRHLSNDNWEGLTSKELFEFFSIRKMLKHMIWRQNGTNDQTESHFHSHFLSY